MSRPGRTAPEIARALVCALAVTACGDAGESALAPPSDADADVESIVRDVVAAIPERDPEAVLRHIALEFRGGPLDREPNLDHADAQAVVLEFMLREHPISARLEDVRTHPPEPDGSLRVVARVWFDASDVLRDPASAIPTTAVRYRFELRFARREGTWQALDARYARMEPASSLRDEGSHVVDAELGTGLRGVGAHVGERERAGSG